MAIGEKFLWSLLQQAIFHPRPASEYLTATICCASVPQGLDTIDSMAFSAMRFCELSSAYPNRGRGNSDLVAALVADGDSIAGLESEIRLPDGETVRE